jgi:GYF domain 2
MDGQEAIWHVVIRDQRHGPLSKAQVLQYLRDGTLTGSDLIWRPGFPQWKPVQESDFWQVPQRASVGTAVTDHEPPETQAPAAREKWSLWKSANIGLLVSAFVLLVQIATGRGFQLANYAHTGSAETIASLIGQVLAAPLIFVLIAFARNLLNWRQAKSSASAVRGALTFAALLVGVMVGLVIYGEVVFSSTEIISGEARKNFIDDAHRSCVRKQRSLGQNATEDQIDRYCTCYIEKVADGTTYKQIGTELDESGLAHLRQVVEAAAGACR